jgi:hypothetical protein
MRTNLVLAIAAAIVAAGVVAAGVLADGRPILLPLLPTKSDAGPGQSTVEPTHAPNPTLTAAATSRPSPGCPTAAPSTPQPTGSVTPDPGPTEPPLEFKELCLLQPPETYALADVAMTLERSTCFGVCPDYTVRIGGDGHVVYEGRNFVKEVGTREADIDRDAVIQLLKDYYEADFFRLADEYRTRTRVDVASDGTVTQTEQWVTDIPTYFVSIQIGKYQKRIVDYYFGPEALRALEDKIDAAAGTDRWVGP